MSWYVKIQINERCDAVALQQLIKESFGFESSVHKAPLPVDKRNWDTRLARRLLESMEPGRVYDIEHFKIVCQENEFAPKSQAVVLKILIAQKKVKRVGHGLYQKVIDNE